MKHDNVKSNDNIVDNVKDFVGEVSAKAPFISEGVEESQNFVEGLVHEAESVKDIVVGSVKEQTGKLTDNEVLELKGRLQRLEADDEVPIRLICTVGVVAITAVSIFAINAIRKASKQ